jgi:hypothetical protein
MAKADSIPTVVRDLFTAADTKRSTNQVEAAPPSEVPGTDAPQRRQFSGKVGSKNLRANPIDRRYFIGGSDARIIMGDDEAALLRLWREKRGEVEPEDLSGNLVVQLGVRPCAGWLQRWTVGSRPRARSSSLSSCCRGHSRKRQRPRNTCLSYNIICGWWRPEVLCFP